MNQVEKLEPVKVVSLLQKKLGWQLDYGRGGMFENNKSFGIFFFICAYHEPLKNPLELWNYTMFYYSNKEMQFRCRCGVEFKNVYEIWSKEKKVDLKAAVGEVNYLIENYDFSDDYQQLPQFKPSYGKGYRIDKKLIKKNTYQ